MISVKKTENCCYYGFKFHHADFTFVAKFPNLEWILCRMGFESRVIQQMECLEKSNSENDISESICLHFYECICFGGIEIMVLWVYDGFKYLGQGEFSFRPGVTLCSLSVRMDD